MKWRLTSGILFLFLWLVSCVQRVQPPPPVSVPSGPGLSYVVGDAYQVTGVWYYPKAVNAYEETGLAIVMPAQPDRRWTSNGEPVDPGQMTAAHPTLQLPAIVSVSNLANGRKVFVRVNDRGPGVPDRALGLSAKAAQVLGIDGIAPVRVTLVPDASAAVARHARQQAPTAQGHRGLDAGEPVPRASPRPVIEVDGAPPPAIKAPLRETQAASIDVAGSTAEDGRFLPAALAATTGPDREVAWRLFFEAGPFTQFTDANRLRARLSGIRPGRVRQSAAGKSPAFVVEIGPLDDIRQADAVMSAARLSGEQNIHLLPRLANGQPLP